MLRMKLAVRVLLLCLALLVPAASQSVKPVAAKAPNQWALLIGINDYPGEIQDLRFARDDARALKDVLIGSAGFQEDHVRLLTDDGVGDAKATKQNILNSIEQTLASRVEANDQVIVFLAGHGIVRGVGPEAKSYFLPIDIAPQTPESLERSALDLEELARKLSTLKASQFTIFVDACREDPFPGRGLKGNQLTDVMTRGLRIRRLNVVQTPSQPQPEAPTSIVFYACRIGERAYENLQLGHGVFTHFIMRGLRELAARPDGRVEAGLLAGYLRDNVKKWREEAAKTNAIFGEQTPTMIATEVRGPVVVAYVTPMGGAATAANTSNALSGATLITEPAGATIFVNGQAAGSGPLFQELAPREYTVRAELAGFQPVESKIKLVAGYQQEVTLTLQPTLANANYEKGVAFENQQLWPQAIAAYEVALREDPSSLATYERLANVYALNARWREAIALLTNALNKFPNNALLLAQRSRAYSAMAESEIATTQVAPAAANSFAQTTVSDDQGSGKKSKKSGKGKKDEAAASEKSGKDKQEELASADTGKKGASKGSKKSKKGEQQAEEEAPRVIASTPAASPPRVNLSFYELALRDAEAAVRLDTRLVAAHLALGFAYLIGGSSNANRALNAFVAASTLAPSEAEAYYGVGAAYRALNQSQQALPQLKKAIALRPDFYEAQRELAYCYHARGETDQAIQQYQFASARRSKIKKSDDLAANDLALASLYQRKGEEVGGTQGEEYKKAAKGYEKDARDKEPSLKGASKKLAVAGVSKLVEEKVSFEVRNLFGKSKEETPTSSSSSGISVDKGGVTVPVNVGGGKLPVKVPVKIPVKIPVLGGGKESKADKSPIRIPGLGNSKDAKVEKDSSKGKKPEGSKVPVLIPGKITLPSKSKDSSSSTGKPKETVKEPVKERTPTKVLIPGKLKVPIKQ